MEQFALVHASSSASVYAFATELAPLPFPPLSYCCRPRTKKVGPYDHCQQLPVPGATMSYWASPEGLEAQKAHGDQLQQSLTRDKLRPVKPPPAVTAGKQLQPGVYLAASTQLRDDTAAAAAAAEAAAAEAAGEGEAVDPLMVSMRSTHQSQFPLTGSGELTSSLLRQSLGATIKAGGTSSSTAAAGRGGGASGLQSTAAMVAAAAPDYGYPSMGYSTKVQSPQTLQARSRGAGLDVYGNVRAVPPALPASHLRVSGVQVHGRPGEWCRCIVCCRKDIAAGRIFTLRWHCSQAWPAHMAVKSENVHGMAAPRPAGEAPC